ncbi:hypothetical protein BKA62DRAFT_718196 [Auriculariales sp. MPI-PUGE-AT-0066]|nr:hypothetical protein BKA62DRAFT_718196 [Auriculariales sp. MPI-PUGE-AT-0066]
MVKWEDPHVIALSIRAYTLFLHLMIGAYLWEYLLNLDFDWAILRRTRKISRGTVLYLLIRYGTLFVACVSLGVTNAFHDPGCKVWMRIQRGSANFAVTIGAGLLYARVWALSEGNVFVVWGLGTLYLANWAITIYGVYAATGVYVPAMYICASDDLPVHRVVVIYQLAFDLICLWAMLYLLMRMHRGGSNSLWQFLVNQGVLYFIAICLVYILDLTIFSLHVNKVVKQIPGAFRAVVTCIAASRMQRGLIEFVEKRPVVTSTNATGGFFNRGANGVRSTTHGQESEHPIELTVESWGRGQTSGVYVVDKPESKSGFAV